MAPNFFQPDLQLWAYSSAHLQHSRLMLQLSHSGPNARRRCGAPVSRWYYDVILLSQPWYDLFDEDFLTEWSTWMSKRRQIIGADLYLHDMITQQFLLFGGAWA